MNTKDFLLFVAKMLTLLGFGGMMGVAFGMFFDWDQWMTIPFSAIVVILGLWATRRASGISDFIASEISQSWATRLSTIYILLAATLFLSPFALFLYFILVEVLDFGLLTFSILLLFYLLKFVDYQAIVTPKTIEANLFSILFIALSMVLVNIIPISYSAWSPELRKFVETSLVSVTIFTHGAWILSMYNASSEKLRETHPKLFYDDMPYRGLFNILAGFFLIGSLYIDFLLSPRSTVHLVAGGINAFMIVLLITPYLHAFIKQRRFIAEVMTRKKYRKILAKMRKDNWESEVLSKSLVARFLNTIIWCILLFATFVALSTLHYCIYTGSLWNLVPVVVLFSMIFTTFHYRIGTRGERIQTFFAIFGNRELLPSEIHRLTEFALIWYSICAGIVVSALFSIRGTHLEKLIYATRSWKITNVHLLAVIFIFTLVMIFYISYRLFGRPTGDGIDEKRRGLQMLMVMMGLTLIISINAVFYSLFEPLSAAVLNSLALILLGSLYFKAARNL